MACDKGNLGMGGKNPYNIRGIACAGTGLWGLMTVTLPQCRPPPRREGR